jgi:L-iditol 2-dehydrogenase
MQFGGKVFIIGVGKNEQSVSLSPLSPFVRHAVERFSRFIQFPFMHLSANEIDVSFQYRYANQVCCSPLDISLVVSHIPCQYPKAIRLIAGGLIDVRPLVTHRFSLEDAIQAFHVAADPAQGAIKVQICD